MIEEEFKKLLEKEWSEEERQMIQRIMEGMLYYRKLLPKALKADVISALQLCNKLKHQLDILIAKVGELEDVAETMTEIIQAETNT